MCDVDWRDLCHVLWHHLVFRGLQNHLIVILMIEEIVSCTIRILKGLPRPIFERGWLANHSNWHWWSFGLWIRESDSKSIFLVSNRFEVQQKCKRKSFLFIWTKWIQIFYRFCVEENYIFGQWAWYLKLFVISFVDTWCLLAFHGNLILFYTTKMETKLWKLWLVQSVTWQRASKE